MKSRFFQLSAGSRARTAASASDPTPAPVPMAGWAVSAKSQYAFCHVSTEVAVWLLTNVTAPSDGLDHAAIWLFASCLA